MPGWVPAGIGLQGMLSQLTATGAPTMTTPSAPGSVPPGWEGPDPSQAAGGGFDWSDAGIGAAVVLGSVMVIGAAGLTRRRQSHLAT